MRRFDSGPDWAIRVWIVAMVAPPTTHDFFKCFQKVATYTKIMCCWSAYLPSARIKNRDSVQARIPKQMRIARGAVQSIALY
jgi:hypothetical protein